MKKNFSIFAVLVVFLLLPACKTTYYVLKPIPAYKPLDPQKYAKAPCYAIYPMPERAENNTNKKNYSFKPTLSFPEKMLIEAFQRNKYNAMDFSRCLSLKDLDQLQHVIQVLQLEACQHKAYDGYTVTYRLVVSVRPPHTLQATYRSRCFQAFYRMNIPEAAKVNKETSQFFTHQEKELLYIKYSDALDKAYHHYFEQQYMIPLFDNLFMNSEFRKALQPANKKAARY